MLNSDLTQVDYTYHLDDIAPGSNLSVEQDVSVDGYTPLAVASFDVSLTFLVFYRASIRTGTLRFGVRNASSTTTSSGDIVYIRILYQRNR